MLVFQMFADRKKREEDSEGGEEAKRFGMKLRKLQQFFESHLGAAPMPSGAAEVQQAFFAAEKFFSKQGLAGELSTLTPGAQNAIKAGSFLWGYENAAKYLKNAMKLAEQKGISGAEEKSREVLGSIQQQASGQNERLRESEKIIWTFYNDALKDFQSQASSTEVMVEKPGASRELSQAPLSAKEAVASALEQQSQHPALLYCSSTDAIRQGIDADRERQVAEAKRGELGKLVSAGQGIPAAQQAGREKEEGKARLLPQGQQAELQLALARREELLREYGEAERAIEKAIEQLELVKGNGPERPQQMAETSLPPSLARLLAGKKEPLKRAALIKQLKKWLAFARKGRSGLAAIPAGKMAKLLSLSSLLGK